MVSTDDYKIVRARFAEKLAVEQDPNEKKTIRMAIFILDLIISQREGEPPHDRH